MLWDSNSAKFKEYENKFCSEVRNFEMSLVTLLINHKITNSIHKISSTGFLYS